MSRRVSRTISISSSDDDEKKSLHSHSSKTRSRKSSSSSSVLSRNSNRQKRADKLIVRSSSRQLKDSYDSSSDEGLKKHPISRPKSNLRKQDQNYSFDSASDSTIKKSAKSSSESLDKPRKSSKNQKKRQILKSSSSSRSRSNSSYYSEKKANSDSDADSILGSSILKIKIESKPPLDKNTQFRKIPSSQSNFEKPDSDSDSQDSNNEMTDVSSLSSPKETKTRIIKEVKIDENEANSRARSAFYSALHQKSHTRPNSVNFNFAQNYTYSTEFDEKTYGRELNRIQAQQRRIFNEFLKENRGKSAKIERPLRLTSAAINRQKEQQRIEKENQMILKRLLSVKSSKEVRKESQFRDYEKNMGISDLNVSRSSIKSERSQKSSLCNSRISSAKSNRSMIRDKLNDPFEFSNRTLSLPRKPEWNNKW